MTLERIRCCIDWSWNWFWSSWLLSLPLASESWLLFTRFLLLNLLCLLRYWPRSLTNRPRSTWTHLPRSCTRSDWSHWPCCHVWRILFLCRRFFNLQRIALHLLRMAAVLFFICTNVLLSFNLFSCLFLDLFLRFVRFCITL